MRAVAQAEKIRRLIRALGEAAEGPGRIYLVGGATAVLEGWRETTVDVDLKLDPEPAGVFEAIARLKDALDVNVELASPDHFVPPLPGWRDRSPFIARHGQVDFHHYDPYGQAFAKIDRGHDRDIADVRAFIDRGLVEPSTLRALVASVEPDLVRYPAIEPDVLRRKLDEALKDG